MTDILERLRQPRFMPTLAERQEAADEIDRLRAADKSRVAVHEAEIRRLGIAMGVQADEITRLQNLILGACEIFCQLDAPHWADEFRRALEPKP